MTLFNKCKISSNKKDDQFVGIKYDGDISITFPLGFNIPNDDEEELRKDIYLLIKSISMGNSIEKESVNTSDVSNNNNTLPIYSYLWLSKEYVTNGLYKDKEFEKIINASGKINWKKTIQKTVPVISNNSFVYLNNYYEKSKNIDTLITEIEKYCLKQVDVYFSWLLGNLKLNNSIFNDKDIPKMKSIVKKELSHTFKDSKKILLSHLLNILNGLDDDMINNKIYSYGTCQYQNVWEKMILDVYGNTNNLSSFYPSANWNIRYGNVSDTVNLKPLRQDAIRYDKNTGNYYILDAKYYSAGSDPDMKGLPSTSDIEKQITYGMQLINNKDKYRNVVDEKVYNALLIPYCSNKNDFGLSNPVEFVGIANTSWLDNDLPYKKIQLIFVDTNYLFTCWKNRNKNDIEKLTNVISRSV